MRYFCSNRLIENNLLDFNFPLCRLFPLVLNKLGKIVYVIYSYCVFKTFCVLTKSTFTIGKRLTFWTNTVPKSTKPFVSFQRRHLLLENTLDT